MNSIFAYAPIVPNFREIALFQVVMNGVAMAALCIGLCATPAFADASSRDACASCNGVRLQDEIVVVNTRMLCGRCDTESMRTGLIVERYAVSDEAGQRRWKASDIDDFLAFDSSVPTIFFVHGNQITAADAKCQGLALYRRLMHYGGNEGPVRFVIYSWPSSRIGGLLRDVRVKAKRTGPAGCQLAWLLDQMPADTPVSLIGFSFGARIITGGLHILAGGSFGCGMELADRVNPDRAPVNVVLIAAALHAHWLGEGQYHGLAMTRVDRMFLLNNCRDLALRYYHLSTAGGGCPRALGVCGPTNISSEHAAKIQMRDVSRYAGTRHNLFLYLCAPSATAQVWAYTGAAALNAETIALTLSSTTR